MAADEITTYKIVRFYAERGRESRVLETGLSRETVEAHCEDPESSSSTAQNPDESGDWFDGWREES